MNDLVSVIITTYKGSDSILRALKSVVKQSYQNIEIIIVDDNGEGTENQIKTEQKLSEIHTTIPLKYLVHRKNMNGAVARNTGIAASSGKYLTFLDDDDVILKDRISHSIRYIRADNNIDAVFCGVVFVQAGKYRNCIIPSVRNDFQTELLLKSSLFGTGSNLFISRKVIEELKGFNEDYIRHQDLEFMLRMFDKFTAGILSEYLVVKSTNETNNVPKYHKLKKSKLKYHNDFEYIINNLSPENKKKYYMDEMASLLMYCFGSEDKNTLREAINELRQYRHLTKKELIYFQLAKVSFGKYNLYNILKKLFYHLSVSIKNNKTLKKLNSSIIDEVDSLF